MSAEPGKGIWSQIIQELALIRGMHFTWGEGEPLKNLT